jgi:hypothetical protein
VSNLWFSVLGDTISPTDVWNGMEINSIPSHSKNNISMHPFAYNYGGHVKMKWHTE